MRFPSIFRRAIVIAGLAAMSALPVRAAVETAADEPVAPAAAPADSTVCIVDRINASGNISVAEPEGLTRLLTVAVAQTQARGEDGSESVRLAAAETTRTGYRIQVFDDNNPRTARSQAQAWQRRAEEAFPQWRAYVSFNSPYWQVKVGDFRRRGEAESVLAEIKSTFPSMAAYMRIVQEKITVTE